MLWEKHHFCFPSACVFLFLFHPTFLTGRQGVSETQKAGWTRFLSPRVLYPSVFSFDPRVIQGSYIKEETGQSLCIRVGCRCYTTRHGGEARQGLWNWEQKGEKNAAWGGVFIPVSKLEFSSSPPTPCTAAPLPALMAAPPRSPHQPEPLCRSGRQLCCTWTDPALMQYGHVTILHALLRGHGAIETLSQQQALCEHTVFALCAPLPSDIFHRCWLGSVCTCTCV